ncbi:MAG: putative secondary metabolism biosynthetic enzyme [Bathelium mastoideum]|nr:MAG: putative secondary metabolism biosynthetic enzyme [Bathelium mastoideum]
MSSGTRLVKPLLQSPIARTTPRRCLQNHLTCLNQRRTFIENPFQPTVQTLTASRTLPYPHDILYTIIADVNQYSTFLPYCLSSNVTKWSQPTPAPSKPNNPPSSSSSPSSDASASPTTIQWPSEATLTVGWHSVQESFTSRIYCVPGRIVEAVSGPSSTTTLPAEDIQHHLSASPSASPSPQSSSPEPKADSPPSTSTHLLTHLRTRWTLHPYPYKPPPLPPHPAPAGTPSPKQPPRPEHATTHASREQTEVRLELEYAFTNPVYANLSKAVAPRVAEMVVSAFEERVKALLR